MHRNKIIQAAKSASPPFAATDDLHESLFCGAEPESFAFTSSDFAGSHLTLLNPAFAVDPDLALGRSEVLWLEVQIVVELDSLGFVGQLSVHDLFDCVVAAVVQHLAESEHRLGAPELLLGAHPVVEDLRGGRGHARLHVLCAQRCLGLNALEEQAAVGVAAHLGRHLFFAHEVDYLAGENHHVGCLVGSDLEVLLVECDRQSRHEFVADEHVCLDLAGDVGERQGLHRRDQEHAAVEGSLEGPLDALGLLHALRAHDVVQLHVGPVFLEGRQLALEGAERHAVGLLVAHLRGDGRDPVCDRPLPGLLDVSLVLVFLQL